MPTTSLSPGGGAGAASQRGHQRGSELYDLTPLPGSDGSFDIENIVIDTGVGAGGGGLGYGVDVWRGSGTPDPSAPDGPLALPAGNQPLALPPGPERLALPPGSTPPRGPDFIVHPNGEIIPVPTGATGPTPADTGRGFQFTGGSGGHGLDPRVTGVRVMDPVTSGKYPKPNGYASYMNQTGQTVDPGSGRTIPRSDPNAHIEWS